MVLKIFNTLCRGLLQILGILNLQILHIINLQCIFSSFFHLNIKFLIIDTISSVWLLNIEMLTLEKPSFEELIPLESLKLRLSTNFRISLDN